MLPQWGNKKYLSKKRGYMAIEPRLKVIAEVCLGQKIYEKLEEESGISRHSWKNALNKKQRATSEMIEFVAREWPEYAFWLVTGTMARDLIGEHQVPIPGYNGIFHGTTAEDLPSAKIKMEPVDWSNAEFESIKKWKEWLENAANISKKELDPVRMLAYVAIEARMQRMLIKQMFEEKEREWEIVRPDKTLLSSLGDAKKYLEKLRKDAKKN